ncbi:LysR family transcriptional regulator [Actinomadura rudentiformis]|uniref:LysR family transcriptional regulator n=1 Tax=Actinomadura rudentiformis TaxID=359158 RepID=A0A6H9Z5G3_9ACTN|nr:LysR family transcriptional regulator [Actinomadura rudentiformis]KAB2352528.1 LysR family transcriptional regulator [Actinomadura rudentiformis]
MDLTIQQLRVVLSVAREGSFTAAGERMRLAQSSLSRTVAEVERRVGITLFERTTRRVLLTPAGREFADVAERVVAEFDRGINHFSGFLAGTRGLVRIATLPSLAATLLPTIVSRFRQDHPDVRIHIEDGLLAQVLDRVRTGQVDLAVTVLTGPPETLGFRQIAVDHFYCVFPQGHRFAGTDKGPDVDPIDWAELAGEAFIAFDQASSVRVFADRALREAGVRLGPITEARNIAAVAGLAAAGLGVSAVPGLVLPLIEFARLDRRRLAHPALTRPIGVMFDPLRPQAPAVRHFMELLEAGPETRPPLPEGADWEPGRHSSM